MSITVPKKKQSSVLIEQIIIIILLVAIVTVGLFGAYKYLVREKTLTPEQMDIKKLEAAIGSDPGNKAARLQLAYTYQRAGDLDSAIDEYNAVLKMDPKELAALYNLGVIAKQTKDYKEAEKYLKKVLEIKQTHVLGGLALGELYVTTKKYDEAVKVLDNAIKVQPYVVRPRIIKAQALEKKGDKKGATREYKEVLKFIPDNEEALEGLKRLK